VPRRLALLAIAALALTITAGCAEDVSPAARIGEIKISDDDLLAEVGEWAGNPQVINPAQLAASPPGTYPQELVGAILGQRITLELHRVEFEELDLELSDELRAQALQVLFGGDQSIADQALGGFSDDFADEYIDDVTRQIAVEAELGEEGYVDWLTATMGEAEIEVSPRYGTWDAEAGTVVPPEGPAQPAPDVSPLEP
jgi:hypothetical protein